MKCVVRGHNAGLFSLINKVITAAEIHRMENIVVEFRNTYYGEGDLWSNLFKSHGVDTLKPGETVAAIDNYPHMRYTAHGPDPLYRSKSYGWREQLNRIWHQLTIREEILDQVDEFVGSKGPFIAALVRSNIHGGEQINGRSQTLEQYEQAIANYRNLPVFPLINDEQTRQWLRSRFPTVERNVARRAPDRSVDFHVDVPQTFEDAKEALIEVLIAARAQALVHPISNMATAALYINPKLTSIYLT